MVNWKEVIEASVGVIGSFIGRGVTPTVRTVYYALVSKEFIPNTINAYKGLSKALVKARKDGKVKWHWIADETRRTEGGDGVLWKPEEYASAYVDYVIDAYKRFKLPKWLNQPYYIEAWIEKFALAQTFNHWLSDMNITLVPSRGYSSWTFLKDAAVRINKALKETEKTPIILYFGDFDPSGKDIERFLGEALEWWGINTKVKRIAVTLDQISQYNLPSTPEDASEIAKLQRDPRYKSWEHGLFRVELDALLAFVPDEFERIIKDSVTEYFDEAIYDVVLAKEAEDKKTVKDKILELLKEKLEEQEEDEEEEPED